MPDQPTPDLPLPSGWARNVKSAVLHVISLAHYAIISAHGWAANAINPRAWQAAEMDRLINDAALLREELRIKDARIAKIDPRRRPYYPAAERMAILELKAAQGWSLAQAARAFFVESDTISDWLKRVDEVGSPALVQFPEPVNKFPDFVHCIVRRLKALCPCLGKVKIVQWLARAGLHLCATTVRRMLKAKTPVPDPIMTPDAKAEQAQSGRVVTAKRPNHVWHMDLTIVPMVSGFWTTWLPSALPQRWPFCWWVAAVVDHFSRRVMGLAVWKTPPTSVQVRTFLGRTIALAGAATKHIICDKGPSSGATASNAGANAVASARGSGRQASMAALPLSSGSSAR